MVAVVEEERRGESSRVESRRRRRRKRREINQPGLRTVVEVIDLSRRPSHSAEWIISSAPKEEEEEEEERRREVWSPRVIIVKSFRRTVGAV